MPGCLLIDGNNVLYRAFYAFERQRFTAPDGTPSGALFGFARMLLKMLREQHPESAAVAFDMAKETFRHKRYPEYKATRRPTPPDLLPQMPAARELVLSLGLVMLESREFEADDLIAAAAEREREHGKVTVVSGDRDLLQLIAPNVTVHLCSKGVTEFKEMNEAAFQADYGFPPEGIVDLKALWGDSSDNIPGVDGIGEKKAMTLIQRFGSVENLYKNLDSIENPKMKQSLAAGRESAFLSHELATIIRRLPDGLLPESLVWKGFEAALPRFREFCARWGFRSLLAEMGAETAATAEIRHVASHSSSSTQAGDEAAADAPAPTPLERVPGERILVSDLGELDRRLAAVGPVLSLDIETDGLDPWKHRIIGFSFAGDASQACYVPLRHAGLSLTTADQVPVEAAFKTLKQALRGKTLLGHNLKFDLAFLAREGVTHDGPIIDTMLAAYVLDPTTSNGLKSLARDLLRLDAIEYSQVAPKGDFSAVPLDTAAEYAGQDVILPFLLRERLEADLEAKNLDRILRDLEQPLLPLLLEMETTGIRLNVEYLDKLSQDLSARLKDLEGSIHSHAGQIFNVNSNKQLQEILFGKLGLTPPKKTKTGFSTDSEVLHELAAAHPICRDLMEYRELAKLKSTYADALAELVEGDRHLIHTSFNQTVTATGRLSSSNPNMQNIPVKTEWGRRIRRAFEPPRPGDVLISIDYSQIELRLLAHFAGDQPLLDAFAHGTDIHALTASKLFAKAPAEVSSDERKIGKTVNFGIIYGISAHGLAQDLGITRPQAQAYIDGFFAQYPGVMRFFTETVEEARRTGKVSTLFGRVRPVPELAARNKTTQAFGERVARNTPLQGSAADLVKKAMLDTALVLREGGFSALPILQIHDELVFTCPPAEVARVAPILKATMEAAVPLKVPLVCDVAIGPNLADLDELADLAVGSAPVPAQNLSVSHAPPVPPVTGPSTAGSAEPIAGAAAPSPKPGQKPEAKAADKPGPKPGPKQMLLPD